MASKRRWRDALRRLLVCIRGAKVQEEGRPLTDQEARLAVAAVRAAGMTFASMFAALQNRSALRVGATRKTYSRIAKDLRVTTTTTIEYDSVEQRNRE